MEVVFKRPIQETGINKEDSAVKSPAKVDSTKSPKTLARWTKWIHQSKEGRFAAKVKHPQKATPQKLKKQRHKKPQGNQKRRPSILTKAAP